jgi:hypothetical protein
MADHTEIRRMSMIDADRPSSPQQQPTAAAVLDVKGLLAERFVESGHRKCACERQGAVLAIKPPVAIRPLGKGARA